MKKIFLILSIILVVMSILIVVITGCKPVIEKITEYVEFKFPIYDPDKNIIKLDGPWFQNFELGTVDQTLDAGSQVVATIYDLSSDPYGDLTGDPIDLTSDLCLQQNYANSGGCDPFERKVQISPRPTNVENDFTYSIDASMYSYLIMHVFLSEDGTKDGIPWNKNDDNLFLEIFSTDMESQIWLSNLAEYMPDPTPVPTNQWFKVIIDLDDNAWTGSEITKSGIQKISLCEYDDFNLYVDTIYFAENTDDPIPEY